MRSEVLIVILAIVAEPFPHVIGVRYRSVVLRLPYQRDCVIGGEFSN